FDPQIAKGGIHILTYTAYGDPFKQLCPSSDSINVFVVSPPLNVDFHTEDNLWQYCVSEGDKKLIPTINGVQTTQGNFSGSAVKTLGGFYYFMPSKGDTLDSNKNVITYV